MATFHFLKGERDVRSFGAGQTIFAEQESGDTMYAVIEGQVDIVWRDEILETVDEGGIFGELALVDDGPRSAAAIARTNCRIAVVDRKRFAVLVSQTPHFAVDVMRVMAQRLRRRTS